MWEDEANKMGNDVRQLGEWVVGRMHAALFARLDARARARRAGLWGRCGPAGIDAFPDR